LTVPAEYEKRLVSVIIPVYNGEAFLARALKSAFDQDYRPLEVIVVDDGSSDATARIAQDWREARYFYQPNQGHGMAKNAGIEKSRGEFLSFLDVDDWWASNKLKMQVDCLDSNPHVGYVISHMKIILESGIKASPCLRPELLQKDSPAFLPSALLVRRAIMSKVGMFNPAFKCGNDSDWFFRTQDMGIPRIILPDVLLYRSIHGKNDSNQTATLRDDMLRLVRASIQRKRRTKNQVSEE
jgi:glycosyltransferase involved in cell wall biosynthesis